MNETLSSSDANVALGQILRVLCRSLPMYLEDARPWSPADGGPLLAALARLVADQKMFARRVADAMVLRRGRPAPGAFPLEFTGLNDVSLDYLVAEVIDGLAGQIDAVGRLAAALAFDPEARDLAEEVLGNLQGHFERLRELSDDRHARPPG